MQYQCAYVFYYTQMVMWSAVAQSVSVRLGIYVLLVQDSPAAEPLCYVLEQNTLSAA